MAFFSITGKQLKPQWPELISNDEADRIARTLPEDERELPINHFSYLLEKNSKALLYLAVRHSTDPTHPQFPIIEKRFHKSKPDCVLYEGPYNELRESNRIEAITRYGGESGFVRWLVKNQNEHLQGDAKPIHIDSVDIPKAEEVKSYQERGYSNEQIGALITAANMFFRAHLVKAQTDKNNIGEKLQQAEKEFMEHFENEDDEAQIHQQLSLVPRSDKKKWTFDLAIEEYKKTTGKELVFDNEYPNDLQEMFDLSPFIKDVYMIRKIVAMLEKYDRIMVVAGSSHPIRQRKALEEYFEIK